MSENLELEKQLKLVARTGSYVVGRREVSTSLKGSKLLVWSASANVPQTILDECKTLSVPAIRFSGNPVELGRACGIPFRVSVIALKTVGDADLSPFAKASDYYSGVVIAPPKEANSQQNPRAEVKSSKAAVEEKPKAKSTKKKKDEAEPEKTKKAKKSESDTDDEGKKSRKKAETKKSTSKKKTDEEEPKQKKSAAASRKKKKSADEEEEEEQEENDV